jgi:hypothetical protein
MFNHFQTMNEEDQMNLHSWMHVNRMKQITTYTGLLIVVGNQYIIDKEFRGGSEVEVVVIYGKHFCRVRDIENGTEWDTMLNRLSNNSTNS